MPDGALVALLMGRPRGRPLLPPTPGGISLRHGVECLAAVLLPSSLVGGNPTCFLSCSCAVRRQHPPPFCWLNGEQRSRPMDRRRPYRRWESQRVPGSDLVVLLLVGGGPTFHHSWPTASSLLPWLDGEQGRLGSGSLASLLQWGRPFLGDAANAWWRPSCLPCGSAAGATSLGRQDECQEAA